MFPPSIRSDVPPLTGRQMAVLQAIDEHVRVYGFAPSYRDIAELSGLASTSAVAFQLDNLEARGVIKRAARTARAIGVTDLGRDLLDAA